MEAIGQLNIGNTMNEPNVNSIDCPDCHLQMLQQQHQQQQNLEEPDMGIRPPVSSSNGQLHRNPLQPAVEPLLQETTGSRPGNASARSQQHEGVPSHYQLGNASGSLRLANSNSPSSSSYPVNMYSFDNSYPGPCSSQSNSLQNGPISVLPVTSIQPYEGNSSGNVGQPTSGISMDPCNYNGYCSTCAALDLPPNDKYYRANSRSHVFPPIFYPQTATSLSECGPWGNEYNPYSYPTSYSQNQSTASSISGQNDYYGTGHSNMNNLSNAGNPCTDVLPASTITTPLNPQTYSTAASSTVGGNVRNDYFVETQHIQQRCHDPVPIYSFISGQDKAPTGTKTIGPHFLHNEVSDDSENESTSGSSIASEERELISVVEEDESNSSTSVSNQRSRSYESGRFSGKCWVCKGPVGIVECSSPQLATILENIEDEITTEDLDISVSSGDIEIGGIEDEMRDFTQRKSHLINPCSHGEISISKLSSVLGLSGRFHESYDRRNFVKHVTSDLANLCFKCGKLVALVEALETRLNNTRDILRQRKVTSQSLENFPLACPPVAKIAPSLSTTEIPMVKQLMDRSTQTKETGWKCSEVQFQNRNGHASSKGDEMDGKQRTWNRLVEDRVEMLKPDCNKSANNLPKLTDDLTSNFKPQILEVESRPNTESESCSLETIEHLIDLSPNQSEEQASTLLETSSTLHELNFGKPKESMSTEEEQRTSPCETLTVVSSLEIARIESHESNGKPGNDQSTTDAVVLDEKTLLNSFSAANANTATSETPRPSQVKTNTCKYCQRHFSTKSNLTAHAEICKFKISHGPSTKKGMGKSKCSNCGLQFRSGVRYKKHLDSGCRVVLFECGQCFIKFPRNSELQAHIKTHLGEKPFKCQTCGIAFTTKGNQLAHSRTHSKEKKFPCNLCIKGFNRRYALMMHINRHNGTKPFKCILCGKSFSDPSNLNNHKKKAHRIVKAAISQE